MRRRKTKAPFAKRLSRRLGLLLLLMFLLSGATVLTLRWLPPPVTAFMLQQHSAGDQLSPDHYHWMDWEQLGSAAPLAIMAAEDQKFPDHYGFDVGSIRKAVLQRRAGQPLRGASTITQQVAKNLFLWPGRSFVRKLIEAYFAVMIEASWPKQRILEVYLNIAEFGPGVYGVPAASRRFFGINPLQLTDSQAALLAAVLPSPKQLRVDRPSAYVRQRQRWIIKHMRQLRRGDWLGRITRD